MGVVINFFDYYKKPDIPLEATALLDIGRFERPSIYEFLRSLPQGASFEGVELPDSFAFNASSYQDSTIIDKQTLEDYLQQEAIGILPFMRRAAQHPDAHNLNEFYNRLTIDIHSHDMLFLLVDLVNEDDSIGIDELRSLSLWLIKASPDRLGVCAGLLLLGLAEPKSCDKEFLMLLGSHEAFTLFAFIVLMEIHPNEQHDYIAWELARKTHGKGRLFIMDRLVGTNNNEIRHWLLCEGYKTACSQPICALKCATKCGLVHALEAFEPDDKLLLAAAGILAVLMRPDEDGDYLIAFFIQGTKALSLLLDSAADAAIKDVTLFKNLLCIKSLLEEEHQEKWQNLERLGWSLEFRQKTILAINHMARRQGWKAQILRKLQFGDDLEFVSAAEAAPFLHIDAWPYYFERQRTIPQMNYWSILFDTDNDQFFDAALLLAENQILLPWLNQENLIESPEWSPFICDLLKTVLEKLHQFPRRGEKWLDLALMAPDRLCHNLAVNILAKWKNLSVDTQKY
ncbi:hypothetical protein [Bartonella sp. HY038]|uniref:hypothetical protein n=1 Tax=Bartonella sp. HY038 TaxID=2759660 RepID=UPI0015F8FFEF|nr:hypothetical protein [Bartonella sp. HY038]